MEKLLKQILDKVSVIDDIKHDIRTINLRLDIMDARLAEIDQNFEGLETRVNALLNDKKEVNRKIDMLVDTVANIKEDITASNFKIQIIDNKVKAI